MGESTIQQFIVKTPPASALPVRPSSRWGRRCRRRLPDRDRPRTTLPYAAFQRLDRQMPPGACPRSQFLRPRPKSQMKKVPAPQKGPKQPCAMPPCLLLAQPNRRPSRSARHVVRVVHRISASHLPIGKGMALTRPGRHPYRTPSWPRAPRRNVVVSSIRHYARRLLLSEGRLRGAWGKDRELQGRESRSPTTSLRSHTERRKRGANTGKAGEREPVVSLRTPSATADRHSRILARISVCLRSF